MNWFKSQTQPIGVDIGSTGARMVQLKVVGEKLEVSSAARCQWDDATLEQFQKGNAPKPSEVGPQLRRLANQGQFSGREVVVALPRQIVQIKNFRMPTMPLDELELSAEHEARALFGVTDDQAIVRAMPAGEVRQGNDVKQEVIAVAARRAEVDLLVEQWHHEGFRPVGFDFDATALYRGMERFVRRRDDEAEVNVLLEVGYKRSIVLIGRGRDLNFCKYIDIGGAMLTHAIARKLGINTSDAEMLRQRLAETHETSAMIGNDPVRQAVIDSVRPIVDELGRELALCLRYFSVNFRGQRPARVRVVGGESSDPLLIQLLEKATPVPIEPGKLIANADLSRMKAADRSESLGGWSLAFGLALRNTVGPFADRLGPPRTTSRAAVIPTEVELSASSLTTPPGVIPDTEIDLVIRPTSGGARA